jgi:hypothetical protein
MTVINSNRAVRGPVTAIPLVAGKGVRLTADTVNNRWVVEADETVLWDGNGTAQTPSNLALSETVYNFERVRITFSADMPQGSGNKNIQDIERPTSNGDWFSVNFAGGINSNLFHVYTGVFAFTTSGTKFTYNGIYHVWGHGSGSYEQSTASIKCLKIVGINRVASN